MLQARRSHCAALDHLYTRDWAWRSDGGPAQQTRLLLVNPLTKTGRQVEIDDVAPFVRYAILKYAYHFRELYGWKFDSLLILSEFM